MVKPPTDVVTAQAVVTECHQNVTSVVSGDRHGAIAIRTDRCEHTTSVTQDALVGKRGCDQLPGCSSESEQ